MAMKWIVLGLLFEFSIGTYAQQIERRELREGFLQSLQRKTALDSFLHKLEKISSKSPVQESYFGICNALQAQYTSSMWTKIRLVTESRGVLNDAVTRSPNDPELRFMRLTFEHFLPSFLGMSRDIPADLTAILAHPDFVDDSPALKKMALEFLINTHHGNADQNKFLQQQLADLNKSEPGYGALTSTR